jgi:hypothetical protein
MRPALHIENPYHSDRNDNQAHAERRKKGPIQILADRVTPFTIIAIRLGWTRGSVYLTLIESL